MTGLNITLDNETLKELMLGRGKHDLNHGKNPYAAV